MFPQVGITRHHARACPACADTSHGTVIGMERNRPPALKNSNQATAKRRNPNQEAMMDWDRVEGNWKQLKGNIKEQWGKLTDDDLDQIAGRRDQLEGKIQERYGLAKDQARQQIDDWYNARTW